MSYRGGRWGPRWRDGELKVEEVIVPVKNDPEGAKNTENSKYQKDFECRPNIIHTSLKLGDREISTFYELVALKKPPVEDFVLGTRRKKHNKKKVKYYSKNNSIPCDLFLETKDTFHPKYETVNDSLSEENFEEKQKLKWKVKNYEETMLQQQESNYRRQRQLEKQTLEQQENLAETWLRLIQRRKELQKKDLEENVLSISPPLHKKRCYGSPIDISLAPKKYWNDEAGEPKSKKSPEPEKGKEKEKAPAALEGLKDEFYEKLIFVDDSDGVSD